VSDQHEPLHGLRPPLAVARRDRFAARVGQAAGRLARVGALDRNLGRRVCRARVDGAGAAAAAYCEVEPLTPQVSEST